MLLGRDILCKLYKYYYYTTLYTSDILLISSSAIHKSQNIFLRMTNNQENEVRKNSAVALHASICIKLIMKHVKSHFEIVLVVRCKQREHSCGRHRHAQRVCCLCGLKEDQWKRQRKQFFHSSNDVAPQVGESIALNTEQVFRTIMCTISMKKPSISSMLLYNVFIKALKNNLAQPNHKTFCIKLKPKHKHINHKQHQRVEISTNIKVPTFIFNTSCSPTENLKIKITKLIGYSILFFSQ